MIGNEGSNEHFCNPDTEEGGLPEVENHEEVDGNSISKLTDMSDVPNEEVATNKNKKSVRLSGK